VKTELSESLLCPRCYSAVALKVEEWRTDIAFSGKIECGACGASYPLLDGIAYLAVIDHSWKPMVKELLSRVEITEAVLSGDGFEKDREEEADEYHEAAADVMDRLFEDAVQGLDLGEGPRLLDVGAGLCQTSKRFADLGAEVVASDVEYTHLQYVNFFRDDAVYADSVSLPIRDPQVRERYFSRIMCDAHRLPFKDGTFDITCCRSTIHHLNGIPKALREMARVTRPGGKVVLISEPVRSFFDDEIGYKKGIFDYEEGLNERSVPIFYYTVPLRLFCDRVEVRYFDPAIQEGTEKLYRALRVRRENHFRDGETLGFGRSWKLLFSGAGVNVKGFRSGKKAGRPPPVPSSDIMCDVRDLINTEQAHLEISLEEAQVDREETYRNRLSRLYREFLDEQLFPTSIEVFSADQNVLRKGFREYEVVPGGGFRYTHKRAFCYIRNDPTKKNIAMLLHGYPEAAGEATGNVYLNGLKVGSYRIAGQASWQEVSFLKPPMDEKILEMEIMNDFTFIPDEVLGNGDRRELGIAVQRIWQI
jgi:ubiquinone/menaquinone biosynthesis C-methylase UbiE/uncharacterized protein YbaR (Trm112 family)